MSKPEHDSIRTRADTPPPALLNVRRGRSISAPPASSVFRGPRRWSSLFWIFSSAAWVLMINFIGRRTPLQTLLVLPPAHFLLLTVITRIAAMCSPRLRRSLMREVGGSASTQSWVFGEGWKDGVFAPVGALLALTVMGEVVSVGRLELGMSMALQTIILPAILHLSSLAELPTPSPSSAPGLFILVCPLLAGVVCSSTVPASSLALFSGSTAVGAKAGVLCTLRRAWGESAGGGGGTFILLWHTAPIATVLTGSVALFSLLFNLPLSTNLYPPPSFLFFIIGSSVLHFVSIDFALAALLECGGDLLSTVGAVVPRGLVVLVAGSFADVAIENRGLYQTAFAIGTALLVWAQRTPEEDAGLSGLGYDALFRRGSAPSAVSSPGQASYSSGQWSPARSVSPPPVHRSRLSKLSFLSLLPFLPFLPIVLQSLHPFPPLPTFPYSRLPTYLSSRIGLYSYAAPAFSPPTLDIVFAFYAEAGEGHTPSVKEFDDHVQHVRSRGTVKRFRTRISVYNKGGASSEELSRIDGVDEVADLPNVGREGGTYLHRILRRFEPPSPHDTHLPAGSNTSFADQTLFMQHHESWNWIADQRFDYLDARTGYLSLGPYIKSDCGTDLKVETRWERMKDIYVMFQEDFCPPTLQLSSWAAQHIVSRKRIVANPPAKYARLKELLEAPSEHWLYTEGAHFQWHGNMSPQNPFLGHALERSWPVIFNCTDPAMADGCPDDKYDKEVCQCFDWN